MLRLTDERSEGIDMMTSNEIKEVSLKHFAQNGYEGTSMGQIADDVGIKKQSIYTHFKGKDELFLQLITEANEKESEFVCNFIMDNKTRPIQDFLYEFLLQCKTRYEIESSTKFWIRTAFFPPNHLNDKIMKDVYGYLDQVEESLLPIFEKAKIDGSISSNVRVHQATAAFMGVLDGIYVEMLYGGPDRTQKRLEASWYMYWRGLGTN